MLKKIAYLLILLCLSNSLHAMHYFNRVRTSLIQRYQKTPRHTHVRMGRTKRVLISPTQRPQIMSTNYLVGCMASLLVLRNTKTQTEYVLMSHYPLGDIDNHGKDLVEHIEQVIALNNNNNYFDQAIFVFSPPGELTPTPNESALHWVDVAGGGFKEKHEQTIHALIALVMQLLKTGVLEIKLLPYGNIGFIKGKSFLTASVTYQGQQGQPSCCIVSDCLDDCSSIEF